MIENKDRLQTPISDIGEFKLIHRITEGFHAKNPTTIKAMGDDAAVVKYGKSAMICSCETMIEGIHFDLVYSPLKHIGYKSVVMAISDIYAMNANPTHFMVAISISNKYPVEAIEEIYEGIKIASEVYKIDLIGGDTSTAPQGMSITINAFGEQEPDKIVYRNGAKHNDLLVVSGDLGSSYLGLLILQREKVTFNANPDFQPDLEPYQYLIERQLKPEARKDVIALLKEKNIQPSAMIDLSDGLASDLWHLSSQSNIGFHVYENKIPMDPSLISACDEFSINPTIAALNGGEDYELLFTISPHDYEKIQNNPLLTVIGFATEKSEKPYLVLSGSDELIEITAQGWSNTKDD